jgi:[FeFe] hydrogenase H-cluster maturation GTPase HydF
VVLGKSDLHRPDHELERVLADRRIPFVRFAKAGEGLDTLRALLLENAPEDFVNSPTLIGDLVSPGDIVILVVPIDKEAPKGRIILPQVQVIRDLLDHDAGCICIKEDRLAETIGRMKIPPALVVTDSQAFGKVAEQTPPDVPMTSFSILFSRQKGDLAAFAEGALAIGRLRPGDRVLVAEACTHHPIGEDIGRVKLPRWIRDLVGEKIEFTTVQGHDFPEDLSGFALAIHCGSCMLNRREVLTRVAACRLAGVPITNYGIAIAYTHGIFERALAPFPQIRSTMEALRRA